MYSIALSWWLGLIPVGFLGWLFGFLVDGVMSIGLAFLDGLGVVNGLVEGCAGMFCVVGFGVGLVRRCVFLEFGFCNFVSWLLLGFRSFGLLVWIVDVGCSGCVGWFWLVLVGFDFVLRVFVRLRFGVLAAGVVLLGECCLWCLISWYFDFAVGLV